MCSAWGGAIRRMRSGSDWSRFRRWLDDAVVAGATTEGWSTGFLFGCGPAYCGGIFLSVSAVGRPLTNVTAAGRKARGAGSCVPSKPTLNWQAGSTGRRSASTPLPAEPIRMPVAAGAQKKALHVPKKDRCPRTPARRGAQTVPGRLDRIKHTIPASQRPSGPTANAAAAAAAGPSASAQRSTSASTRHPQGHYDCERRAASRLLRAGSATPVISTTTLVTAVKTEALKKSPTM